MATNDVVAHFDILSSICDATFLRRLLERISEVDGGRWRPERYNNHDPVNREFDPRDLRSPVELWLRDGIGLTLKRTTPPKYELDFWGETPRALVKNQLYAWVRSSHFRGGGGVDSFLMFMNVLYDALRPAHGYAAMNSDYESKNRRTYRKDDKTTVQEWVGRDLGRCLRGVYWANYFGPEYVSFFGQERVHSAPCHRQVALSDGGCLLLTASTPLDFEQPEANRAERLLLDHLGNDAFFDTNAPDRPTRSPWSSHLVEGSTQ